jgi:hypothetical protein
LLVNLVFPDDVDAVVVLVKQELWQNSNEVDGGKMVGSGERRAGAG